MDEFDTWPEFLEHYLANASPDQPQITLYVPGNEGKRKFTREAREWAILWAKAVRWDLDANGYVYGADRVVRALGGMLPKTTVLYRCKDTNLSDPPPVPPDVREKIINFTPPQPGETLGKFLLHLQRGGLNLFLGKYETGIFVSSVTQELVHEWVLNEKHEGNTNPEVAGWAGKIGELPVVTANAVRLLRNKKRKRGKLARKQKNLDCSGLGDDNAAADGLIGDVPAAVDPWGTFEQRATARGWGLEILDVGADGDCFYRSVLDSVPEEVWGPRLDQLGKERSVQGLRNALADNYLQRFVAGTDAERASLQIVADDIRAPRSWSNVGGDVAPQLVADLLGVNIVVIVPDGRLSTQGVEQYGTRETYYIVYNGTDHYMATRRLEDAHTAGGSGGLVAPQPVSGHAVPTAVDPSISDTGVVSSGSRMRAGNLADSGEHAAARGESLVVPPQWVRKRIVEWRPQPEQESSQAPQDQKFLGTLEEFLLDFKWDDGQKRDLQVPLARGRGDRLDPGTQDLVTAWVQGMLSEGFTQTSVAELSGELASRDFVWRARPVPRAAAVARVGLPDDLGLPKNLRDGIFRELDVGKTELLDLDRRRVVEYGRQLGEVIAGLVAGLGPEVELPDIRITVRTNVKGNRRPNPPLGSLPGALQPTVKERTQSCIRGLLDQGMKHRPSRGEGENGADGDDERGVSDELAAVLERLPVTWSWGKPKRKRGEDPGLPLLPQFDIWSDGGLSGRTAEDYRSARQLTLEFIARKGNRLSAADEQRLFWRLEGFVGRFVVSPPDARPTLNVEILQNSQDREDCEEWVKELRDRVLKEVYEGLRPQYGLLSLAELRKHVVISSLPRPKKGLRFTEISASAPSGSRLRIGDHADTGEHTPADVVPQAPHPAFGHAGLSGLEGVGAGWMDMGLPESMVSAVEVQPGVSSSGSRLDIGVHADAGQSGATAVVEAGAASDTGPDSGVQRKRQASSDGGQESFEPSAKRVRPDSAAAAGEVMPEHSAVDPGAVDSGLTHFDLTQFDPTNFDLPDFDLGLGPAGWDLPRLGLIGFDPAGLGLAGVDLPNVDEQEGWRPRPDSVAGVDGSIGDVPAAVDRSITDTAVDSGL
ncbi:OTU domain-containing protein, partial [Saccharopolyspora elongata]